MKIVSAVVIGLFAAVVLVPASASAADTNAGFRASPSTEFSASKKYRRAYWPAYSYHYVVPSHDFVGPYNYPGEYAMRKSYGQCVLDLGYGRWRAC
jgi:hypothetical protein